MNTRCIGIRQIQKQIHMGVVLFCINGCIKIINYSAFLLPFFVFGFVFCVFISS